MKPITEDTDLSKVPHWVNFIAKDEDNKIYGFESEPAKYDHSWGINWKGKGISWNNGNTRLIRLDPVITVDSEWHNSLIRINRFERDKISGTEGKVKPSNTVSETDFETWRKLVVTAVQTSTTKFPELGPMEVLDFAFELADTIIKKPK